MTETRRRRARAEAAGFPLAVRLLALLALAACGRTPMAEKPYPAAGVPVLRLLSYNVNFGIPGDTETMAAIRDAEADLALLIETNAAWEWSLRRELAKDFPHMVFKNRRDAGGLGVLSRHPILESEFLPSAGEGGWFPAVRVVVQSRLGELQLLGVHLRPAVSDGGSYVSGHFATPKIRAHEIRSFMARLDALLPTVVAGDFNEDEEGDTAQFLKLRGFVSALRRFVPGQPTWRWPTAVGELRKELDHIYYDGELDALSAEVRQAGRSDHLPIIAVIARRDTRREKR
jgi:endonuclease/exonuclease/phosphatase (EEP) superfamily protein YafD